MNNGKFGFHKILDDNYSIELLNLLDNSRIRLRAIQSYTDALQSLSSRNNKDAVMHTVKSYTPIVKLLGNDIDTSIDASIDYLIFNKQLLDVRLIS